MGPPGPQTLTATAPGVAAVTFTATSVNACEFRLAYTAFTTTSRSLSSTDCLRDGHYVDFFTVAIPQQPPGITFHMASSHFDAYLWLRDLDGNILAFDDDWNGTAPNPRLSVFAPAGTYLVEPTAVSPGATGLYALGSTVSPDNTGCQPPPWVVPDLTLSQAISSGDCDVGGAKTDRYLVWLRTGQRIRVTHSSAQFNAYLRMGQGAAGSIQVEDDDSGPGDAAQIEFTASFSFYYRIEASTATAGATGAYTLTVQRF
jgi:hypothetical protein